ncbi:hypothetical protein B296_00024448 [Ensete ventricosum]|uniref:Uncharacterized protein n=1 Tax=Ensete ventricosum TaxID=4639 RepID=A0A426XFH9_ENSVE|nr:hypothetical protein B296_00024448 [Ensete ventricosum]
MKNLWNDMISLLPLQEFMSLTSVQEKLRAFAPCSIFYVDSLHVAWILHQFPSKLLHSSICIKLMVVLMPTIQQVNTLLSLSSTLTLSVSSYDVVMVALLLDLIMHSPMHYLIRHHAMTPRCLLNLLSFVEISS